MKKTKSEHTVEVPTQAVLNAIQYLRRVVARGDDEANLVHTYSALIDAIDSQRHK